MIALAVVDLVRLQLDIIGQLEVFERAGKLDRVERLRDFVALNSLQRAKIWTGCSTSVSSVTQARRP